MNPDDTRKPSGFSEVPMAAETFDISYLNTMRGINQ